MKSFTSEIKIGFVLHEIKASDKTSTAESRKAEYFWLFVCLFFLIIIDFSEVTVCNLAVGT